MWDIKKAFCVSTTGLLHSFHLNHVGYKAEEDKVCKTPSCRFHLNHVGYKVGLQVREAHNLTYFHLNHVGYKEKNRKGYRRKKKLSSEPCGI